MGISTALGPGLLFAGMLAAGTAWSFCRKEREGVEEGAFLRALMEVAQNNPLASPWPKTEPHGAPSLRKAADVASYLGNHTPS